MIVKIQQAQPPFGPIGEVLVYTQDHSRWWQGKPDADVQKWMGDDQKIFAHAHIEGSEIVIDREAPWQDW